MAAWCNRSSRASAWPVVAGVAGAVAVGWLTGPPAVAQQTGGRPAEPPAQSPPGGSAGEPPSAEFAPPAPNAQATEAPDPDSPQIIVSAFLLRYSVEHPQFPALDDLMKASVTLGRAESGFVRPGGGVPTATYTLEELSGQAPQRYTWGALQAVAAAVQRALNDAGIVGVQVRTDDVTIAAEEGRTVVTDVRPRGQTALTLMIGSAVVTQMRTTAFGEKVPFEERINNPRYQRILDNSPVQPFNPDDEFRSDLLRKDLLDDYVYRLNRQPGRRVDLSISAAEEDNGLVLDYAVTESKPWSVYFQASNTGTRETNDWRERFGYVNNQLTNHDDIFSIDYITAGFDASHALNLSYDRPLWGDWLRGRVFGAWSEFTASDVGSAGQDFEGDTTSAGGELVATVFQRRDWFVDLYAGARWENIGVRSPTTRTRARDDFFLPSIGTRLEHITGTEATTADVGVTFSVPSVADTNEDRVRAGAFQRLRADPDFATLGFNLTHSFYLEPLLIPGRWRNTDISRFPDASPTLAHEIALSVRGQYAFNYRLIPNFEEVAGGLYTVRGYPESVSAGDSVVIGTVEYRFHLPQALGFDPDPQRKFLGETFRALPQAPYGRADWDLILEGFLDAARTVNTNRQSGEHDDTLVGTGVGAELLFRRNLSVRVDWGVALHEIENEVTAGSNRFHISVTILY